MYIEVFFKTKVYESDDDRDVYYLIEMSVFCINVLEFRYNESHFNDFFSLKDIIWIVLKKIL